MKLRGLTLVCAMLLACGGDDDSDSSGAVTTIGAGSNTTGGPTPGEAESSDGSTGEAESGGTSTSGADASTGGADSSGGGSTGGSGGAMGDPTYPTPTAGNCPDNTVNVTLPGAELCAPFCTGEADTCPAAATGEATPLCTPFAQAGGSEDPCDDSSTCSMGEACSVEGTCVSVAFWACRLLCDQGETCPDAMTCAGALSCGY